MMEGGNVMEDMWRGCDGGYVMRVCDGGYVMEGM